MGIGIEWNILEWKCVKVKNALAYYTSEIIIGKGFILYGPVQYDYYGHN
jgi:hypothetical protein